MTESQNTPKLEEKTWEAGLEEQILEECKQDYDFTFKLDPKKKTFTIDNPPPYPSGSWHVGAAAAYSMIDMIARVQRMRGFNVYYPFGYDRNGINIEQTVEKATGKKMYDFERGNFVELCEKEIKKFSNEIETIGKRVAISADFENAYSTDSPDYRAVSQAIFIELFKKGLVFKDYRPNNYCPDCRTVLADADIYYKDIETFLSEIKFKIKETGEEIKIATTRPELLCACKLVVYSPGDSRYPHLKGKHAVVPIYNQEVPIKEDEHVSPEFGTGLLMVCSYGDSADIDMFRKHSLEAVQAIGPDGLMTKSAGKYTGLKPKEASRQILEELKGKNLIVKQDKIQHRTPICERSKNPVEFIALEEWYLKQLDFREDVKKLADKVNFLQKQHKQMLFDWIDALTIDWPISRNRYYHTEIPIWYCKKCKEPIIPEPGPYYQPWKQKAPFEKCPKCGGKEFEGEKRVFETWMDSSCSPYYISKYGKDEEFFKHTFPNSIRTQGKEIIRTWCYYTLLKGRVVSNSIPWKTCWIHGMGLDEHGKKMSKSIGNVVAPLPIIQKYSADAFRFWIASETSVGEDFRVSEERISGALKFLAKLWNISKFISMFEQKKKPKTLNKTDEWILSELNKLKKESLQGYDVFDFFVPSTNIREFTWNIFAAHYLEMIKARAYSGDESALYTLHESLKFILKLLAPICPLITHKIYKQLYNGKIHYELLPDDFKVSDLTALTAKIIEFNSQIWKYKKDENLSLKAEIAGFKIPGELEPLKYDLVKMHNLR